MGLPFRTFTAGAPRIAAKQAELGVALAAAEPEAEAAGTPFIIGVCAKLAVAGGNYKPVFIVGDCHIPVHLLHLGLGEADAVENGWIKLAVDMLPAHVRPHCEHA